MLMLRLLLVALFAIAMAGNAIAWPLLFTGPSPSLLLFNVSPSTIWGTWQTNLVGDSNMACTPHAGGSAEQAVDNGVQTSVNNHMNTVAGLVPSTLYDCTATTHLASGGTITLTASASTLAFPASTAITSATYGTPVQNSTFSGQGTNGDTWTSFIHSDGLTYTSSSDHGAQCLSSFNGANSFYKFSDSNLTCAVVNDLTDYLADATCAADGYASHITGVYSHASILYVMTTRVDDYAGSTAKGCAAYAPPYNFPVKSGGIIKSTDEGHTWLNWQGTGGANGALPTPVDSTIFDSATILPMPSPVMYGADDGTPCGSNIPAVDNCDAYLYVTSADAYWQFGTNFRIARIPLAKLPNLNSADIQYYTGGDGSLDAAWSSSSVSAANIITNAGMLGRAAVGYLKKINRYFVVFFSYPGSAANDTYFTIYESPHPWGPWTLVQSDRWNATPGAGGWYLPYPLHSSIIAGTNVTLLTGCDYTSGGTCYQLWRWPVQMNCGGVAC